MALGVDYERQDCSLARALELVGERWTMLILRDAFFGVRRFSDFAGHLDISRAVLTTRLAGLVDAGLLRRTSSGHPLYDLTDDGLALWPAVYALAQWGERTSAPGGPRRLFRHAECDARLDPTGRCPDCALTPPPSEVVTAPGPGADPTLREDAVSVALRSPHRLLEPLRIRGTLQRVV